MGNNTNEEGEGVSVNQVRKMAKNGTKIFASKLEEIVEEPMMGAANSNSVNQSLFHGHHNPLDSIVSVQLGNGGG